MKKVLIFLAFTILWPIEIYCQNINNISDEYGSIYIPINDSTIIYNTKKGEKYEVKLDQVSFLYGKNALVDYLKKGYYKPDPGDDDYTYRAFFFILFDSKSKRSVLNNILRDYKEQRTDGRRNQNKSGMYIFLVLLLIEAMQK